MKKEYYAIIEKDKDSCFAGYCPDYPGVIGTGDTIEEAKKSLVGAIEFYLEDEKAQEPSSIEKVESFSFEEAAPNSRRIIIAIQVNTQSSVTKRVNITINEEDLAIIDNFVSKHNNWNRSNLLAKATIEFVERYEHEEMQEA